MAVIEARAPFVLIFNCPITNLPNYQILRLLSNYKTDRVRHSANICL